MTHHVVIAGGGVGALEGLLALQHLAADRLEISVITATPHLAYRALSVAEPFGADPAPRYAWERIARDRGVRWISDTLQAVDTDARHVETRDGPPVRYDALLLALGARPEPALPGTIPFAGPRDVLAIRDAIESLRPGRRHVVAFVAPSGVAWTLPLYELALLTSGYGRTRGLDLHIEVVTPESGPLDVFGPAASAAVARRLAAAGIRARTGTVAEEYDEGKLWLELEGPLEVDLAIALPCLRGPAVPGLPDAPHGFVAVDPHCRVRGVDRAWAVGDMTTRPLKQGGLATQQADVAAADIAANVAGVAVPVRPYRPRLQGMLLTGDDPIYLERRRGAPSRSEASSRFLWWPAHKVAGRHIGRYLDSLIAAPAGEPSRHVERASSISE
jgi:sulfide:quinone oxidoreductase